MSLTTSEMTPADIAAVAGGSRDGFSGDGWWIILFLILVLNGGWGNGNYGGNGSVPWIMNTDNDIERGFNHQATMGALNSIQGSLCNGFAGIEAGANARQIADMNQAFGMQTAMMQGFNGIQSQFADCCCENRLGLADLKFTVATEACADRSAVNEALRDVIASNTANTQAILDKMCQQEIEAYKRENDNLRSIVNMQTLAASQTAQTAQLVADNTAQTQYIVNRVAPYPIPSYTVPNPYGTATTS